MSHARPVSGSTARPIPRLLVVVLASLLAGPVPLLAGPSAARADEAAEPPEKDPNVHPHEHAHPEHDETETIVVTASPLEHDRDQIAIPVARIEREALLEHLGSSLGETLVHVPGITTTGFAAGASRPVIRGQDAYRTEVLEDGLRTHDVSRESPDHAVPVNPLAAERVEVLRGPGTLRYGGGASAGVINTITHRVPDRMPRAPISGEVYGGVGLVANERDLAASLDGAVGSFAWHADGVLRRANDYAIPNDGTPHVQSGSQYESWVGALGGAWIEDGWRLGGSYTRLENRYGIPEEDESVDIDMQTDRFRFEGDLEAPVPGIREIRLRGVYSDYEHDEIAGGAVGQTYRNEEFSGRLEVLHEPVLGFVGAGGLHVRTRDFRAEGEAAEFLAPTETRTAALYLFEERPLLDWLTGEAGLRVEYDEVEGRDIQGEQRHERFVPLSAALGLVASPTGWLTVGVNGAVSQRAPAQVELLARGAHEATRTFEIGDPDLDEETSFSGNVRIELEGTRGRIEGAGFLTRYHDYIFGDLTGIQVDEDGAPVAPGTPDALDELRYRSRDALFYGAELQGELDLWTLDAVTIGLDGRFDFVRARFLSGPDGPGRNVPRIVPIRWGSGIYLRTESLDARMGFLRTEAQEDVNPSETSTASFTMLNASLRYRLALLDERVPVDLTVVARNLTDVRARNHVAFNKDEVLQPGRSIRFGVRTRF